MGDTDENGAGTEESSMDHDLVDENDEQTEQETEEADTAPPAVQPGQRKPKNPCITCNKNVTGASVRCNLCNLWCHKQCTNLSAEAYKGLLLQAKEVGTGFWACKSCLSFASKMNRHLQESSRRQDAIEAKVDRNMNSINKNAQDVEELRQELRQALAKIDNDKKLEMTPYVTS
jgi:hypothetical protein